jgi:hypothetical protein
METRHGLGSLIQYRASSEIVNRESSHERGGSPQTGGRRSGARQGRWCSNAALVAFLSPTRSSPLKVVFMMSNHATFRTTLGRLPAYIKAADQPHDSRNWAARNRALATGSSRCRAVTTLCTACLHHSLPSHGGVHDQARSPMAFALKVLAHPAPCPAARVGHEWGNPPADQAFAGNSPTVFIASTNAFAAAPGSPRDGTGDEANSSMICPCRRGATAP